MPEQAELGPQEFRFIREFVRAKSGILLGEDKSFLVVTRLTPLLWRHQMASFGELAAALQADGNGVVAQEALDLMTTNESWFFRDAAPFDGLRDEILPGLVKSRMAQRRLSVWSAACSAGQEAYSTAMTLMEHFAAVRNWDLRILATDISSAMLKRVRLGEYDQFEVNRGLPVPMLVKYFSRNGLKWRINDDLKMFVDAQPMNLNGCWPALPTFDVIFLRNVLIYFEQADRRKIVERMTHHLAPDGAFFLGGSEIMEDLSDRFTAVNLKRGRYFKLK